jgi:anti-anti-sigma factor
MATLVCFRDPLVAVRLPPADREAGLGAGMPLHYAVVTDDGDATVYLVGEIDLARAGDVERTILRALAAEPTRMRIDLSAVTFLDASGIRALMVGGREARERGIDFELGEASEVVERVLDVTRLRAIVRAMTERLLAGLGRPTSELDGLRLPPT